MVKPARRTLTVLLSKVSFSETLFVDKLVMFRDAEHADQPKRGGIVGEPRPRFRPNGVK